MAFRRLTYATDLTDEAWQILAPSFVGKDGPSTSGIPHEGRTQWHLYQGRVALSD
jgi:hypothetical protein